MNRNQFEYITRRMANRYGKIADGEEEPYMMLLATIEGNLLKTHRKYPASNSRRALDGMYLALWKIDGYLRGEQQDVSRFEDEEDLRYRDAVLAAVDPFTNPEVRKALRGLDLDDTAAVTEYFREPVMCIVKIADSAAFWIGRDGSDGYFQFTEATIGRTVKDDDTMNYTVFLKK